MVFQNAPEKVSAGEVETMMKLTHGDSKVLASLVVELDLGAFKQKTDNGIPLRRAAYMLQEAIYDRKKDQVALAVIENICMNGALDTDADCIVLNLNMLVKLSHESSVMIASHIDQILAAICPIFEKHVKSAAKSDRAEQIVAGVLRAFHAMVNSETLVADPKPKLNDFIEVKVKGHKDAAPIYEKINESYKM